VNARTSTLLVCSLAALAIAGCEQGRAGREEPFRTHARGIAETAREPAWTIESGTSQAEGRYCRAKARIPGGTVSLTGFPESEGANLTVTTPAFAGRDTVEATVQFDEGVTLSFPESILSTDYGLTIIIENGRYFLNDVARAGRLTVTAGERTITVPLHGRDAMIRELSRCWNSIIEETQEGRSG
jgi:hypothetical protein